MEGKTFARGILVFAIIMMIAIPIVMQFAWAIPADIQYGNLFGGNVNMAVSGAATLTGRGSIQDYAIRIWKQMNQTFAGYDYTQTYNNYWYWTHVSDNTLAKQNEYFQSLNQSLTTKQAQLDAAVKNGGSFTDVQQMLVNQTRKEMNAYGGLDWVIRGAWYLNFAPSAYWTFMYQFVVFAFFLTIAIFAFFSSDFDF